MTFGLAPSAPSISHIHKWGIFNPERIMPRARTPTNVLELSGAFKKNPKRGRERADEPEPKAGIGPAPEWLGDAERKAWDYIVGCVMPGVLGDSDRVYLEVAAELLALKRAVGVMEMESAKLNRLEMMLGKLGMNPADRSRVKGKPVEKSNPFGSF